MTATVPQISDRNIKKKSTPKKALNPFFSGVKDNDLAAKMHKLIIFENCPETYALQVKKTIIDFGKTIYSISLLQSS